MNDLTYKEHQERKDKPVHIEKDGVYIKGFDSFNEAETYKYFNLCDKCVIVTKDRDD